DRVLQRRRVHRFLKNDTSRPLLRDDLRQIAGHKEEWRVRFGQLSRDRKDAATGKVHVQYRQIGSFTLNDSECLVNRGSMEDITEAKVLELILKREEKQQLIFYDQSCPRSQSG